MRRPTVVHAFVFVGAILLFSLEPLVGRLLLPRFGGGFHVWTTALMFYQGALFVAYLYAHLAAGRLGVAHLAVVALPLAMLPPGVGDGPAGDAGTLSILALLARHVALPFGVLATTAVVAQGWWAQRGREPYGLYAVSNAGSLGALLLYALVIEPSFGLAAQRTGWAVGYGVYLVLAVLAWRSLSPARELGAVSEAPASRAPPARTLIYWGLLSAAPSAFLMAVTNLVALDAGNVPLVWVVPLAIYLASFVVAFAAPDPAEPDESRVPRTVRRLWPHFALVGLFFFSGGDAGGGWLDVAVHLVVLAFLALAAHGELYRTRPAPAHLTRFYLVIAAGGWAGGALVAVVAPLAFPGLWEYPIAVALLAVTLAVGRRAELGRWLRAAPRLAVGVTVALVAVIGWKVASVSITEDARETLAVRRSFYGVYRVTRTPRAGGPAVRDLVSGTTRHGRQREGDLTPLSYYHPRGPLGDVLEGFEGPRRVGVVGLGVGAAAGHLRAEDRAVFYEIDPAVVELARAHFTYLSETPAEVEIVVGDARVALERDRRRYDLLFVDAFAGDAIPTHLLTVEALRLYRAHLALDGLLLLHVSNRYYDLGPVLAAAATRVGLHGAHVARDVALAPDQDAARCVALAVEPARVDALVDGHGWTPLARIAGGRGVAPWTDDHANLFDALLLFAR